MPKITEREIVEYIEQHIESFHSRRLESLTKLKLRNIITRKNPYLFRAKNIVSGPELVRSFLDAYLSSQEEGIFGTFLEGLARLSASAFTEATNPQPKGSTSNLLTRA